MYDVKANKWTLGPVMPLAMDMFACVAITSSSGLLVGGHIHAWVSVVDTVFLFSWESRTITQQTFTLDAQTKGKQCQKIELSTGKSVVLCTLGIKVGDYHETGETYVYDILAKTFERESEWDFPTSLITGTAQTHSIGNRMLLGTSQGMFLFKDNETSTETSSHWFKVGDWGLGQSASFNLRYIIP